MFWSGRCVTTLRRNIIFPSSGYKIFIPADFLAAELEVPGSIPGAARYFE
jgi:hypothetical protein